MKFSTCKNRRHSHVQRCFPVNSNLFGSVLLTCSIGQGGGAGNEGNARGAGLLTAEKGKGRTWPWIEFQTTKTLQHPVTSSHFSFPTKFYCSKFQLFGRFVDEIELVESTLLNLMYYSLVFLGISCHFTSIGSSFLALSKVF